MLQRASHIEFTLESLTKKKKKKKKKKKCKKKKKKKKIIGKNQCWKIVPIVKELSLIMKTLL